MSQRDGGTTPPAVIAQVARGSLFRAPNLRLRQRTGRDHSSHVRVEKAPSPDLQLGRQSLPDAVRTLKAPGAAGSGNAGSGNTLAVSGDEHVTAAAVGARHDGGVGVERAHRALRGTRCKQSRTHHDESPR